MNNKNNLSEQSSLAKYPSGFLKSLLQASLKNRIYLIIAVLALVIFGTLPFMIGVDSFFIYYLFMVFIYIVVAQGWNLVGGYTGQVSLGTHAFFALGGYTTALIWLHNITHTWYYFDPLVMVLSGVVPAIFAIIIGIPTLSRLRGDYFSFGTLAAAQILQIVILRTTKFSGGAVGLRLPGGGFTDLGRYYWTAMLLAVLAVLAVFIITKSRIGLALRAISEDETSAASHGIHILRYKLFSFVIGSFIIGVCGSLFAYYQFIVNPSSMMSLDRWMFYPILICVLGGNGTIIGPVIGAFIIVTLFTFGENLVGRVHPMLSGVLIILVMKYMPTGLWGLKDKISPRR
ncbi:MAG: branched-chain amino acid ABC transporter permease [Thermodesulfobacteriota bacterium]|jgi:branched-chain amino acid transport system permease protein